MGGARIPAGIKAEPLPPRRFPSALTASEGGLSGTSSTWESSRHLAVTRACELGRVCPQLFRHHSWRGRIPTPTPAWGQLFPPCCGHSRPCLLRLLGSAALQLPPCAPWGQSARRKTRWPPTLPPGRPPGFAGSACFLFGISEAGLSIVTSTCGRGGQATLRLDR